MEYYQEITIISQPDTNDYHILSALYDKLHGIVFGASSAPRNIGISFPEYVCTASTKTSRMGGKVRIFTKTKEQLEALDIASMLSDIEDYVHIRSISEVGEKPTHYEVYTRYKHKSLHRKAKEFRQFINSKRDGADEMTEAEALKHCIKHKNLGQLYPFVRLTSTTTNKTYYLNIKKEVVDKPTENRAFDGFGLSQKDQDFVSTVPAW